MSYSESLFLILCGALLGPFFNSIGMLNGQEALDYYAEVHQSNWNSLGAYCWYAFYFLWYFLLVSSVISSIKCE